MRRIILSVCIVVASFSVVRSQSMGSEYRTALGFKFYPGAITFKHFLKDNRAVEGLAYFWDYGTRITGLYEIHGDINGAPGLKWYVGPGAHIGFWNTKYKNQYGNSGAYLGVDGVLGLDYKVNKAPINLSFDWQPSFSFGDGGRYGFESGWGGFAVRFTF